MAGTSPLILYENNGDGTFTNATAKSKLTFSSCERLAVGDYDNDGYIDVYLMPWGIQRALYRNNGDGTFTDVTGETKVRGMSARAGGCALADYDNDGDLDLFEGNNSSSSVLYRNEGNDNHWLHVKCLGSIGDIPINIKRTNRDGVGARVIVQAGDLSMIREINPGCSRGYNPLIAYFGLGQNVTASSVEIRWPSGQVTTLSNVPADQMIEVKEGLDGYKTLHTGEGMRQAVEPSGKLPGTWGKVKKTELLQNYPNPFNPETWIPYQLAKNSSVVIKIHTSSGQLVRTLELGDKLAGLYTEKTYAAHWDGTNESGEPVASGVYFYTIQAGDEFTETKKMVVAR